MGNSHVIPVYPEKMVDPDIKPEDYVFSGVTREEYEEWKLKTQQYRKNNSWPKPEPIYLESRDDCVIS